MKKRNQPARHHNLTKPDKPPRCEVEVSYCEQCNLDECHYLENTRKMDTKFYKMKGKSDAKVI